jgi:hypothetical protein
MNHLLVRVIAVAPLILAASLPVAASATPAGSPSARALHQHQLSAAARPTVIPFQAQGCSGNACIQVPTPKWNAAENGFDVTISGCAWQSTVKKGHILISGPSGTASSATTTWYATSHYCTGSDDYFSHTYRNVQPGNYCSTTWNDTTFDGTACEYVAQ